MVMANTDYQCGVYQLTVNDGKQLTIQGRRPADYQGAILDKHYDYLHQFGDSDNRVIIRETQKGRVALRIPGESRWLSCTQVFLGFER